MIIRINKLAKFLALFIFIFTLYGCNHTKYENKKDYYQLNYYFNNEIYAKDQVKKNSHIKNLALYKEGYNHLGWSVDKINLLDLNSFRINSDTNLYPLFEVKKIKLNIYNYEGKVFKYNVEYNKGFKLPSELNRKGYSIKGVIDKDSDTDFDLTKISRDVNLLVLYEPMNRDNVVNINLNYDHKIKTFTIIKGDTYPLLPTPEEDQSFRFYLNEATNKPYLFNHHKNEKITSNLNLRAIYHNYYTLTFKHYEGDIYPQYITELKGLVPKRNMLEETSSYKILYWVNNRGDKYNPNKAYYNDDTFYWRIESKASNINYFEYLEKDNEVEITKFNNPTKQQIYSIIIPSYINDKPVTKIGDYAFEKALVYNLTLPKTLKTIGNYAFYWAKTNSFNFPDSLEDIGEGAFMCSSIVQAMLSDNIKIIKKWAFKFTNLGRLKLPNNLEEIGVASFASNANLLNVYFPKTLKKIGAYAFGDCTKLTKLVFNDNLEEIGDWAFFRTNLLYLELPKNLKKLGLFVFADSTLVEITLHLNYQLAKNSFTYLAQLSKIYIYGHRKDLGKDWNYDSKYNKYHSYEFLNKNN